MLKYQSDHAKWLGDLRQYVTRWKENPSAYEYLGDQPFPNFVRIAEAENWGDFTKWHDSLKGRWGFRGQRDAGWPLHPSLDREKQIRITEFLQFQDDRLIEDGLLFQFRQQAHHHMRQLPDDADLVSWLALMQHHGAPTRLLDWTRSPYVAAYFAFEDANLLHRCCPIVADNDLDCALKEAGAAAHAIWAIDLIWLLERGSRVLLGSGEGNIPENPSEKADYLNALFKKRDPDHGERFPKKTIIVEVEPRKTDAWMISQQGFFLSKQYPRATFSQLLMGMMLHPELIDAPVVQKLEMSDDLRLEFLRRLRQANIHRGSLFPDLDGFSRSLLMGWGIDRHEQEKTLRNRQPPPEGESDDPT